LSLIAEKWIHATFLSKDVVSAN